MTKSSARKVGMVWLLLVAAACGGGCPKPDSPPQAIAEWERRLEARQLLPLDPKRELTIKRDVRSLVVSADAKAFANAFHDVLRDPKRHFGLIEVDRKVANVGKPFSVGEKFQGRYDVQGAIEAKLKDKWRKVFGKLAENEVIQQMLCSIENQATSDYGEIMRMDLAPPEGEPFSMSYAYLEGSPIAGSSTFTITPLEPGKSRLTQVFLYQEQSLDFATFFAAGGLKLHNQVVYQQALQAAELVGATIVESDIPREYGEL